MSLAGLGPQNWTTSQGVYWSRSPTSGRRRPRKVYFQWDADGRAGAWTIRIDTPSDNHNFDIFGRDDQGSQWDDRDRSNDGDERITFTVQSCRHLYIRVMNYDCGANRVDVHDRTAQRRLTLLHQSVQLRIPTFRCGTHRLLITRFPFGKLKGFCPATSFETLLFSLDHQC